MSVAPSFKQIYEDHVQMVFNLCLNYVQHTEDAEELTQDVFVKVAQQLPDFKAESQLKTWIYRITIHQCIDFLRAKKRKKRWAYLTRFLDSTQETPFVEMKHPGILLEQQEALEILFSHINELPEQQKTALLLKTTENLSQQQIADIMEISVKAVESLLQRAKTNLHKKISS